MKIDPKKHRTLDQCANLLVIDNLPPPCRGDGYDHIMQADYDFDLDTLDMFLGQLDESQLEDVCMGEQDKAEFLLSRAANDSGYIHREEFAAYKLLNDMFDKL